MPEHENDLLYIGKTGKSSQRAKVPSSLILGVFLIVRAMYALLFPKERTQIFLSMVPTSVSMNCRSRTMNHDTECTYRFLK